MKADGAAEDSTVSQVSGPLSSVHWSEDGGAFVVRPRTGPWEVYSGATGRLLAQVDVANSTGIAPPPVLTDALMAALIAGRGDLFEPIPGEIDSATAWTNGSLEPIAWPDGMGIAARDGSSLAFDPRAIIQPMALPSKFAVRVSTQGAQVHYWSFVLGRHGQLISVSEGGTTVVEPPHALFAPRVLWAMDGSRGLGFYDFFELAQTAPDARLARLRAVIARQRGGRPDLMLERLSVSQDLSVAALEWRSVETEGRAEIWSIGASPRPLFAWEGEERVGMEVSVERLDLEVAGGMAAHGLLYRAIAEDEAQPSRGLVVYLGGGPGNTLGASSFEYERRLLTAGFDVLALEYRGSVGHGWDYLVSAHGAPLASMTEDGLAAIAWAQGAGYERIGAFGVSFGGLGVLGLAAAPESGLAFAAIDSGLVMLSFRQARRDCDDHGSYATVLGVTRDAGGCKINSTGAERILALRTPTLFAVGLLDQQTLPPETLAWIERARAVNSCASVLVAPDSGHAVVNWPPAAREAFWERFQALADAAPSPPHIRFGGSACGTC